jgi:hypothetical protein
VLLLVKVDMKMMSSERDAGCGRPAAGRPWRSTRLLQDAPAMGDGRSHEQQRTSSMSSSHPELQPAMRRGGRPRDARP